MSLGYLPVRLPLSRILQRVGFAEGLDRGQYPRVHLLFGRARDYRQAQMDFCRGTGHHRRVGRGPQAAVQGVGACREPRWHPKLTAGLFAELAEDGAWSALYRSGRYDEYLMMRR